MSDPTASIERIEGGGIPEAAERRLAAMGAEGSVFTSDLSTADFALCRQAGLRPLAQVMGSSVYQVGYQGAYPMGYAGPGRTIYAGGLVREMETLTDAWNEARDRALNRLAREAQVLGADAVVGVQIVAQARDFGDAGMSSGAIEYSVVGTAVARTRAAGSGQGERTAGAQHATGSPSNVAAATVLTELSVADYAKLLAAGVEPKGIAAWSSVFYATISFASTARAQPGLLAMGQESFELREFTAAIYAAREQVMERMGSQGLALGATGMVGVRISHQMRRTAMGQSSTTGLLVTFHAIGTAIDDADVSVTQAPKPVLDMG
ncbi:MAG: heavy metal-binding domain-containing protein [Solirubrobacteraceae bacterium]